MSRRDIKKRVDGTHPKSSHVTAQRSRARWHPHAGAILDLPFLKR